MLKGSPQSTLPSGLSLIKEGCNFHNDTNAKASTVVVKQADCLDENRVVLYKKGRLIGEGYFIVEISSNNV